jgi:DNA invertase Pin-like site-specific DNA recombinase
MSTAAYLRVSSDKQDASRQRLNVAASAERIGKTIGRWYEDSEGRNSRHRADKRKAFQQMLADVQAGSVKTIIVDSQDRFGTKDAFEWGKFVSLLRDHECELLDASGRNLTADDDGSVLSSVVGALTSKREQREKAHRNITGKVGYAKRGEYQGGYAPYATDVVCFGPDGKEKWRTVYVGHLDRLKLYPNGKQEKFVGKNATPAKDTTDTLRLRPSIRNDRIKAVRQIFKWYATEDISPGKIADRLNELKIQPVFSEAWYKQTIKELLRNPVYIGLPAWNKRAGSEFVEYVGGQFREINGKPRSRRRQPSDFVQPDKPEFAPIIDRDTWNIVQRKLAQSSPGVDKRSAPHTAELWLRPFLVCGRCLKPMHATNGRSTKRLFPSYFCGTYNRYGAKNPTGCHCHRVRHKMIEEIVRGYLDRVAPKVAKLLKATEGSNLQEIRPILESVNGAAHGFGDVVCEVLSFVEDHADPKQTAKMLRAGKDFLDIYGLLFDRVRPNLERQLAAKQAELDKQLDDFAALPARIKQRAIARMEPIQAEIDDLQNQLNDWRRPYVNIRDQLTQRREAIKAAQKTITKDGAGRAKSEAMRGVIDRVVLHFRHTKNGPGGKSYLKGYDIHAASGDVECFSADGKPGPG